MIKVSYDSIGLNYEIGKVRLASYLRENVHRDFTETIKTYKIITNRSEAEIYFLLGKYLNVVD